MICGKKLTAKLMIQTIKVVEEEAMPTLNTIENEAGDGFEDFEGQKESERLFESGDEVMEAEKKTIMH